MLPDKILLVSSPNNGGLALIHKNGVVVLDREDTTGIWLSKQIFLRNIINFCPLRNKKVMQLQLFKSFTERRVLIEDECYDFHDIILHKDLCYLVSTGTNEIISLDLSGNIVSRKQYPGNNDSWHINCLAIWNDRLVASAFGEFDTLRGYKNNSSEKGFIFDIETDTRLFEGLSQPHNPVEHNSLHYVCNSEKREVLIIKNKSLIASIPFDGYTRGLAFDNNLMYVGISKTRNVETVDDGKLGKIVLVDPLTYTIIEEIEVPFREVYAICPISFDHPIMVMLLNMLSQQMSDYKHLYDKLAEDLSNISAKLQRNIAEIDRINQDIALGWIIKFFRWIKHDNNFGKSK